jgi:anaerobic magnesium-protoporphyrin IX monomethyl ester cyclase
MILLVNPRSAIHNRRIPLALLTVGAGLDGRHEYEIIDENFEPDVKSLLDTTIPAKRVKYVGLTVMPGPQLVRAIAISKHLKRNHPGVCIIWGGTFPTIHTSTVLASGYVDIIVLGQGEIILPSLIDALESGASLESVKGIAFNIKREAAHSLQQEWQHPESRPPLPYHKIDVYRYLQKTYLGNRTSAYHSSLGCPFKCGFCSVVSILGGRWLAQSADRVAQELELVHNRFGVDSVEFFDDNFFTSERRIADISERIRPLNMAWWGEGRSDTIYAYSDATLRSMREAGCKMIFTGAETGSTETLKLMNKGGTQSPEVILEFARRIQDYDIVPEFSFVFGSPSEDVDGEIDRDIQFIKKLKRANPRSEIIFYVYAPVLLPGSAIFEEAKKFGFDYPKSLDEWMEPKWLDLDLRKKPMTPWIKPRHVQKIMNFERVLNAQHPSIADLRLTEPRRQFLKALSHWRYTRGFYSAPYEIRFFLSSVFKYRQPDLEGAPQYGNE